MFTGIKNIIQGLTHQPQPSHFHSQEAQYTTCLDNLNQGVSCSRTYPLAPVNTTAWNASSMLTLTNAGKAPATAPIARQTLRIVRE